MVEDTSRTNSGPKSETARPKALYLWTRAEVSKWLLRHCNEYYQLYNECFTKHDITGRALLRMNDNTLIRLGIDDPEHRNNIWREILKLKLKMDIIEIRNLEMRSNFSAYDLQTIPV